MKNFIIVDDLEADTKHLTPEKQAYWHNEILKIMKKKIYIAGKVTGLPKDEVYAKFADLQTELENIGFIVVNPLEVVNDWNATWEDAMKKCLKALIDCDGIYFMPCHTQSVGAMLEKQLATSLKIPHANNVFNLIDLWSNSQPTP